MIITYESSAVGMEHLLCVSIIHIVGCIDADVILALNKTVVCCCFVVSDIIIICSLFEFNTV